MGRAPCCQKVGLKRGRWTAEEDQTLINHIKENGEGSWRALPKNAGLLRCGKSCRLRWINYLRKDLKRGNITPQEEDLIIKLHATIGNRWSLIATQLPGRTDNEIKNHWNSHLSRSINSWRRPANDTLPQNILDNLAKLMSKPDPSNKKESKKSAPSITMNATGRDNKKPMLETEDSNEKPKTAPDGFEESLPSCYSWSTTDQSLESIFSLEEDDDDNVGLLLVNEMVTTPLMDHMITPQSSELHASNEFQNLDAYGGGDIDIDFMNYNLTNLSTSHAEMEYSPITMDDNNTTLKCAFDDPIMMKMMINTTDWNNCWEDYGEILDQDLINYEEVDSFLMPWIWDCDDV